MSGHPVQSEREPETIRQKVDGLVDPVDRRFDAVDRRFDAVGEAFAEQRQYTEFAFERLRDEMRNGFAAMDGRFDGIDGRFDRLEQKLDQFIDTQSATNKLVERRLGPLETRNDHQ